MLTFLEKKIGDLTQELEMSKEREEKQKQEQEVKRAELQRELEKMKDEKKEYEDKLGMWCNLNLKKTSECYKKN